MVFCFISETCWICVVFRDMRMFKCSVKACYQEGVYPTQGFLLSFQSISENWLLCSWNTGEGGFWCCLLFTLLEHCGGAQSAGALLDIELQPAAVVMFHVPPEGRSLTELKPSQYWETGDSEHLVVYYWTSSICFSTMNLLSLWHSWFQKYATVSTLNHKLMLVFWSSFSGS